MVIFLTILKIILILLLVLAGILAVILFVPIRYRAEGSITDRQCRIRVGWLFGLVGFRFEYKEEISAVLRLLMIRIDFTDEEKKAARAEKKGKKERRKRERERKKLQKTVEKKDQKERREQGRLQRKIDQKAREPMEEQEASPLGGLKESESASRTGGFNEKESEAHAQAETSEQANPSESEITAEKKDILGTIRNVGEKIPGAVELIRSVREQELLETLMPRLIRLLKHIFPKRIRGEFCFGFDDPSITGQVLGAIAVFPLLYQTQLHLVPDFETDETYFDGWVDAKGRIFLIHIVIFVISLLLQKNIRSLIGSLIKNK